ncbi:polysaccharide deacetylase family protein [Pedobacter alpinus]|uniref:Polysaccharide deacetylase family protein n=1 Tax=Pedobacter alpinus TaxID=1590643 RepID=A0ABW5TU49_9SPHI
MALLIYTFKLTERIKYAATHIFEHILGVDIEFSNNLEVFNNHQEAKIVYDYTCLENTINFKKHAFIDEENIVPQSLVFANWKELQIPFSVKNSVFTFDVFAATFYFLSRYEEYLSTEKDEHLRFAGKSSLAYKNGFIKRPLVDEWAYEIAEIIKQKYKDFEIKHRQFKFIPTLDIDRPYYYRTDSFLKKTAKIILSGFKNDPYDVYEMVKKWDKEFGLKTIYFFLLSNKHVNDVAPNSKNKLFKKLINETSKHHDIGIHPSYFSFLNSDDVLKEKYELENIANKSILKSRQHYLLLNLPKTYQTLITADITEDYTMAFADVAGFRATTCTPFYWFDLSCDKVTNLKIYPTAVMDQTLKRYMSLSITEAEILLKEIIDNVKEVNGTFISLWHNESINNFKTWKNWQPIYLTMLAKSKS